MFVFARVGHVRHDRMRGGRNKHSLNVGPPIVHQLSAHIGQGQPQPSMLLAQLGNPPSSDPTPNIINYPANLANKMPNESLPKHPSSNLTSNTLLPNTKSEDIEQALKCEPDDGKWLKQL